jgi:hypothetical protein
LEEHRHGGLTGKNLALIRQVLKASELGQRGVETTGNAGTNGITASDFLNLGAFTGGSSFFGGSVVELGIDFTVHNGTARTAMCHNQFAYWATSTSC